MTYGYEMYSIISGARIPIQMAIADRTLDPPGDFGSEHTDALCTRDMGWLLGWAATPQEVFDKSLIAYAIGEDPRVLLPQMVVQDGYFVSHIAGEVECPRPSRSMPTCRPTSSRSRSTRGGRCRTVRRSTPSRARRSSSNGPGPWRTRSRSSGTRPTSSAGSSAGLPHFVESYLLDDAEIAIVISGGHAVTCRTAVNRLRAQGIKIGMARLLWIRPFPSDDLREALRGVKAVGVVETNLGLGGAATAASCPWT